MKFSQIEITDLLKSWIAISIAFGIIIARNLDIPLTSQGFIIPLLISALTVGIGFLFHELGHKYIAQKYNYWAEFRASNSMLIFALILAYFTSFIFAAPGAVMIQGYYLTKEKNGRISAAGPIVNLILGSIFIILFYFLSKIIGKLVCPCISYCFSPFCSTALSGCSPVTS